ncbi:MAG: TRZ/ATZ family hydrolase [Chromatiales bacterium]|jgi:5-methylthioadenosine/S-adenosylhomocysteine deaminase|nr:TRZ/ATZ family hydrolase [Chromatiales bacterium]
MHVDLLIRAGWIVPAQPRDVVYHDHCLAIARGRIVDILPVDEARRRCEAKIDLHLPDHVLIPGLVNAHTHAAMSLFRGLADDLPLMTWLQNHIWPAEATWVREEFVRQGTELAIAEMIRGGTTCFNDMYFFPQETALAASQAGMRATVGLIMIDFPTAWASGPDEYLSKGLELHERYRGDPLIRTAFAPHAPYTVSDEPLRRLNIYAEELDLPIHIHLHETASEVETALAQRGERPLKRLAALGLLSPRLLAVHMTQLEAQEIEQLAATGVHVLHCPESNLKLASGFCPVAELSRAGVNVALGTDGAASNNDLDMFGEMRTAALLAKAVSGDASAISAIDALRMATINGARALGLEHEIGSLEPGKSADVVAVDLGVLETRPVFHPASHLVYACGRHQVTDVWIAGKQVLRKGRLTTLDEAQLRAQADVWGARIVSTDRSQ